MILAAPALLNISHRCCFLIVHSFKISRASYPVSVPFYLPHRSLVHSRTVMAEKMAHTGFSPVTMEDGGVQSGTGEPMSPHPGIAINRPPSLFASSHNTTTQDNTALMEVSAVSVSALSEAPLLSGRKHDSVTPVTGEAQATHVEKNTSFTTDNKTMKKSVMPSTASCDYMAPVVTHTIVSCTDASGLNKDKREPYSRAEDKVFAAETQQKQSPVSRPNSGRDKVKPKDKLPGKLKGKVKTSSSVLPKELLQQVTDVTREKVRTVPGQVVGEPTQDALIDGSDISILFSDTFGASYKCYTKEANKKAKKRKRRERGRSEGEVVGEGEKRAKNSRPNYFLSIQVDDDRIHENASIVQQYMLSVNSVIQKALIPVPTLHLTLMVMCLENEEQIQKAVAALDKCSSQLTEFISDPITLQISGIGHFRDQVVFANTDQVDRLQSLADLVAAVFEKEGIVSSDQRGFQPHITLLKLSKAPALRKKGIKKIGGEFYSPYKCCVFGQQTVKSVQLCAMLKPKASTGYYHVEHQIPCAPENYSAAAPEKASLLTLVPPHSSTPHRNLHTATHWTLELIQDLTWNFTAPENTHVNG